MAINHHEGRMGGVGGGDKASGGFFEKRNTSASTQSRDKHQPDTQFFYSLTQTLTVCQIFLHFHVFKSARDRSAITLVAVRLFFFFSFSHLSKSRTTQYNKELKVSPFKLFAGSCFQPRPVRGKIMTGEDAADASSVTEKCSPEREEREQEEQAEGKPN